jgi:hypothetical protein
MSEGVREIRTVGGRCHGGLNCKKKVRESGGLETREEEISWVKERAPHEKFAHYCHVIGALLL